MHIERLGANVLKAIAFCLLAIMSSALSAQGDVNLTGSWTAIYADGSSAPNPGVITQTGTSLDLDNGQGSRATGQLTGNSIEAPNWGVTGALSADGQRIDWSNGTHWVRQAARASSRSVSGLNVSKVVHDAGWFAQTSGGQWTEFDADGTPRFSFTERSRDEGAVSLVDTSRDMQLQLDIKRKWITFSQSGGPMTNLYPITSASADPIPPRAFPETYRTPLKLEAKSTTSGDSTPGYYVIAHMTNVTGAVDWALEEGANALEMDINFKSDGTPEEFRHGGFCDCACGAGVGGVCGQLGDPVCDVSTDATEMLNHVAAKTTVALVVIDSKVNDLTGSTLETAGTQIIQLLDRELFGKGYRGEAIVGIGDREKAAYLVGAANAALGSDNREHYFFSIDQGGDQTAATLQTLMNLPSNRRVYGTGLTACTAAEYHEAVKKGVANERAGVTGLTYIWTIDKSSSMTAYLEDGARGIITNMPGTLAQLLKTKGYRLAQPGERIPASSSNTYVASSGSSVGTRCDSNSDCDNVACARPHANGAEKVCCASNDTVNYWGYDYCANMASGTVCWSDAMCASGNCKGNGGGTKRGTCE